MKKSADTGFRLQTVAAALGVPYRTLARWCQPLSSGGIIAPEGAPDDRQRRKPVPLGLWDIMGLSIITELRNKNCPLQKIRPAINILREKFPGLWDRIRVEQMAGDERRAFLMAEQTPSGGVKRLCVIDLDRQSAINLQENSTQMVFVDVFAAAQRIHDRLQEEYERAGYATRISFDEQWESAKSEEPAAVT